VEAVVLPTLPRYAHWLITLSYFTAPNSAIVCLRFEISTGHVCCGLSINTSDVCLSVNTDLIRVFINKHQACEFQFLCEHTSYMCVYVLLLTSVACADQRWKVKVGSPWGHRDVSVEFPAFLIVKLRHLNRCYSHYCYWNTVFSN